MPEARFDVFPAVPAPRTSIVHELLLIRRNFIMYPSFMRVFLVTRWSWTWSTGLNVHIELRVCGVGRQPKRDDSGGRSGSGLGPILCTLLFNTCLVRYEHRRASTRLQHAHGSKQSRSTGNPGPGHNRDHGIHGPGTPGRTQVHAGPVSRANSKPWSTWVPGLPGFRLYPGSTT